MSERCPAAARSAARGSPVLRYRSLCPGEPQAEPGDGSEGPGSRPGKRSFSSVNSTQEESAARLYSKLWLSKKESSERLRGLLMAVTRYSE